MAFEWVDLLNPLVFVAFAVWLMFEMAILAVVVACVALPLVCIFSLIQDKWGKR